MLKKVIRQGFLNFKKNWLSSCILTLIAIVFVCTGIVMGINSAYSTLSILFLLFVSFPILFAVIISNYGHRKNIETLRWSNIFRYSISYFKTPYRGTFRIISSILVFLICTMLLETLFTVIGFNVVSNIYPYFPKILEEIYAAINAGDMNSLNQILITYQGEFNTFQYIAVGPATMISLSLAILFSLYNIYYAYYLINFPLTNLTIAKICFRNAKIKVRTKMMKGYMSISWVFVVLLFAGYFLSNYLFYLNNMSFYVANVLSMVIGVGAALLYLPLFLSFNEELFIINMDLFDPNKNDSVNLIINSIDQQIKQYVQTVDSLQKSKAEFEQQKENEEDLEK